MKAFVVLLTFLTLSFSFASPPSRATSTPLSYPNSTAAINSGLTLKILGQQAAANARAKLAARGPDAKCNLKNVSIRREWSESTSSEVCQLADGARRTISKSDRKQYVKALYCLYAKPNIFNTTEAPGAKNYWDSFTATHIREGNFVHNTVYVASPPP